MSGDMIDVAKLWRGYSAPCGEVTKVINCDDVDVAWSNFKDLLMSVVDKIAPLKEKRLKQRSEPWITSELLDDIRARDQALETFRKNKTDKN